MPRYLAILPALIAAACAHTGDSAGSPVPAGARYVALGSSFAAGAAIGPSKSGTPERCGRTVNNYATLLAEQLRLTLDDQSCGGATTAHVLGPWNELPAQIDAVDAATRLVTVTIGGNDVNYAGNLFMASCTPGDVLQAGKYKVTCVAPAAPEEAAYQALEAGLLAIAGRVRERAPGARLVFVQYVSLVPRVPCEVATMPAQYAQMNRAIGRRLSEITARVARRTGSLLLEADRISRGHTPCDAEPWSNGMTRPIDLTHGAPWHPNAAGHKAIAAALQDMLDPGA